MEGDIGRAISTHGNKKNAYRFLVVKTKRNRQIRRPRHVWEDNRKINIRETE
jgi:hypothetical protein